MKGGDRTVVIGVGAGIMTIYICLSIIQVLSIIQILSIMYVRNHWDSLLMVYSHAWLDKLKF